MESVRISNVDQCERVRGQKYIHIAVRTLAPLFYFKSVLFHVKKKEKHFWIFLKFLYTSNVF